MAKKNDSIIRRVEDFDEQALLASMEELSIQAPKKEDKKEKEKAEEKEVEKVVIVPPKDSKQIENSIEDDDEDLEGQQNAPKESTTTTRKQGGDFKSVFLSPRVLKARQCVYISGEVHEKICKIVNQIADKDLTVGTYVDTILLQHLKKNKNEINALYKKERGDLI